MPVKTLPVGYPGYAQRFGSKRFIAVAQLVEVAECFFGHLLRPVGSFFVPAPFVPLGGTKGQGKAGVFKWLAARKVRLRALFAAGCAFLRASSSRCSCRFIAGRVRGFSLFSLSCIFFFIFFPSCLWSLAGRRFVGCLAGLLVGMLVFFLIGVVVQYGYQRVAAGRLYGYLSGRFQPFQAGAACAFRYAGLQ